MVELALSALVQEGLAQSLVGDGDVRVRGIRHDSRAVECGELFAAIDGVFRRDGTSFIPQAIERGASAVLADRPLQLEVPVLVASDVQRALSGLAARLYDDPTAKLEVVGVTGTNGKTTVAYLLEAVLSSLGQSPAVIGTINVRGPGGVRPATHTTPMADDLMRLCAWAQETGASHLLLEVSSHALAQHRADGVHFAVAALTNLSHDHLDYHGDMASYAAAKRRLFEELRPGTLVLNVDDGFGETLARELGGSMLRCSRRADADAEVRVLTAELGRHGIDARLALPDGEGRLTSALIGEHNLENLITALGCGLALGLEADKVLQALSNAPGAPGRMEPVPHPGDVRVFVDYAHTPDALTRALQVLRPITEGRLLVCFGCGGDRDAAKRAPMGRAAGSLADRVILTNDNPRDESPQAILAQLQEGVRQAGMPAADASGGYSIQPDRAAAIRELLASAKAGDTVLIAGKGHETYQLTAGRREPFDDREQARQAIAELGVEG